MSLLQQTIEATKIRRARIAAAGVPDHGIDLKRAPKDFVPLKIKKLASPPRPTIHDFLLLATTPPSCHPFSTILARVCGHFGVSRLDISSARRTQDIVRPRQICMYLAKETTGLSFPDIGRRLGGKDHTTVLHAVRKIAALRLTDPQLDADINTILAALMAAKAEVQNVSD